MKKKLTAILLSLLLILSACADGNIGSTSSGQPGGELIDDEGDSAAASSETASSETASSENESSESATSETVSSEPATSESASSELPENDASDSVNTYTPENRGYGKIGEFSAKDLNGDSVTEEIFGIKPITFINYWATWCGPCRSELPDFNGMYDKYKDQVTFVTIVDDGENNDSAKTLVEQYLSGYTNILPTSSLVKPIQSGYVPTSVIVDAGGYLVVDKIIGAVGDYSKYIDAALEIVNG